MKNRRASNNFWQSQENDPPDSEAFVWFYCVGDYTTIYWLWWVRFTCETRDLSLIRTRFLVVLGRILT
jgi:hypothetical protein